MKIFLSWSGERSKAVATALRNWIPLILHYAKPWLSQQDITAGDRWSVELGKELNDSLFGILCLTKENLPAPWILFEAGAISKTLTTGAVCPYLFELEHSDISGPLSQFQSKKSDRQSTKELLEAINSRAPNPVDEGRFIKLFDTFWPEFETQLSKIPTPTNSTVEARSLQDILEDLVQAVRSLEARFRQYENNFSFGEETIINFIISSDGSVETSLSSGEKMNLIGPSSRLVHTVASRVGLSPDRFGLGWHFEDAETRTHLYKMKEVLDLGEKYSSRTCNLIITDIPF